MKRGVIYTPNRSKVHYKECIKSAAMIKKHNPDLPIALFTDTDYFDNYKDNLFEYIFKKKETDLHPFKFKLKYLLDSPFENTLYLDTDIKVFTNISELFRMLLVSDFSVAHEPNVDVSVHPPKFLGFKNTVCNDGMFLFNSAQSTKKFINKWYEKTSNLDMTQIKPGIDNDLMSFCSYTDQYIFNELVHEKFHLKVGMKLSVLDNKIFNVRPESYDNLTREERYKIKVLHGHNFFYPSFGLRMKLLFDEIGRKVTHS